MSKKRKIKSFIRTDRKLHSQILNAMVARRWCNKDLIEVCAKADFRLVPSMLSTYLKHGGNAASSLTDESIIFICIVLGIDLSVNAYLIDIDENFIREKFDYFFPKSNYPELAKSADRLTKYYKNSNMIF